MSDIPLLAAAYAIVLAGAAALLSRPPARGPSVSPWSQAQVASFRGGIACTLLVLAGFVLVVATGVAARHRGIAALGPLGAAALVVGGVAVKTARSRQLS